MASMSIRRVFVISLIIFIFNNNILLSLCEDENIVSAKEETPESEGVIPETKVASPEEEKLEPQVKEAAPEEESLQPQLKEAAPETENSVSEAKEVEVEAENVVAEVKDATVESVDVDPEAEGSALEADQYDYSDYLNLAFGKKTPDNAEGRQIMSIPNRNRLRAAVCNEVKNLEFCWSHHNECDKIEANQTSLYLANDDLTPVWSCDCEMEFYNCLHRINSPLSNRIGEMYFTFHKRCFRVDFQIDSCNEYDMSPIGTEYRCIQYLLAIPTPIANQFFDLPYYQGKEPKDRLLVTKKPEPKPEQPKQQPEAQTEQQPEQQSERRPEEKPEQ